jgi:hypothetical protein
MQWLLQCNWSLLPMLSLLTPLSILLYVLIDHGIHHFIPRLPFPVCGLMQSRDARRRDAHVHGHPVNAFLYGKVTLIGDHQ